MLCARVIRGISSIESSDTPVAATSRTICGAPRGSAKPITVWPARKPLAGGAVVASNQLGSVYVVAGGAGAELYGFGTPGFWTNYIESVHTAAVIRARKDTLTMETFHADGTVVPEGAYMKTHP